MSNNLSNGRLRVFTWHIHGSYLLYLSQGDYDLYIPYNDERSTGYVGRGETFPFGDNVIEVHASEVRNMDFDIILFQTDENYLIDQYNILSESQRTLPRIYLEHDPPWDHPTNARHPVREEDVLVVHVTHFNALMWDCSGLKTRVIEHGVLPHPFSYQGNKERGIVVINNLPTRGRLLGLDIFEQVRKQIPLDLVGMGAESYGIGEVLHPDLPAFVSQYRFFFNPIRYTSLGLAVCEAMMLGLPIVGLATTEMAVKIKNGYSGFVSTNVSELVDYMQMLLEQPATAQEMGRNAHEHARQKFDIKRFASDWKQLFEEVVRNVNTYQIN
ncbi:glycosyltransferase family 4 protein [Pedobacter endophyticus]|uniref:Glycosyltransferase family 4 protein n=1 Tax=Pedobacter endophyticus TaxID=2789740 RepID=A0A7S9L2I4_9SPHI|nr:glycosyltransferase family 4 protein [Pedobacter endophyticus]QPH41282.1 glycosyltransferase family 4 protein [Pedobacter endophyticus]